MEMPDKTEVQRRKDVYLNKKIELLAMPDDPQPVPVGTLGEVYYVDDIGQLLVKWENGSGLNVSFEGGDKVRIIQS